MRAHDVGVKNGLGGGDRGAVGDLPDEERDVDRGRTGRNARRIVAEQAALGGDTGLVAIQRGQQIAEILAARVSRDPVSCEPATGFVAQRCTPFLKSCIGRHACPPMVCATGFDQMIKNARSCQTRRMFRDRKRKLPRLDRPRQQLLANSGGRSARALSGWTRVRKVQGLTRRLEIPTRWPHHLPCEFGGGGVDFKPLPLATFSRSNSSTRSAIRACTRAVL